MPLENFPILKFSAISPATPPPASCRPTTWHVVDLFFPPISQPRIEIWFELRCNLSCKDSLIINADSSYNIAEGFLIYYSRYLVKPVPLALLQFQPHCRSTTARVLTLTFIFPRTLHRYSTCSDLDCVWLFLHPLSKGLCQAVPKSME